MSPVLLSIKPKYSQRIFDGTKKFEFRKKVPSKKVSLVYVYESSPTKKVVGYFLIKGIHTSTPIELWEQTKRSAGITKEEFFKYFNGTKEAFAIEVDEIAAFGEPLELGSVNISTPPQSFAYLSEDLIFHIDIEEATVNLVRR